MHDPLATLLADGVIEEVCARLKSGKEADLWLVRHGGEIVAAKVYKARQVRSFRNNSGYKEGRQVRDTRTQRAMDRGTRFGQVAAEEAWKAKEADALYALHAAGVRVPKPVLFYEGVLLMELVVDANGRPAPRLVEAHVARDVAAALYADLRGQVVRMLGCDVIHGDLSPYNVLLGCQGPVVIDFPQVVGAAHNSQAESFFQRDFENLRRFFAGVDPALRTAANDAREIWRAYVRRELTPDFVPSAKTSDASRQHGHGYGERHHPRPHEGATVSREPTRLERGHRAGRREAPAPARSDPQGRRHFPAPGARQPGGRGPDRSRAAPAPEVIRVGRSALGPVGTPPVVPHRSPSGPPLAHPTQRADGLRSNRRRRRRRRGS
jgi:RIO kinase 1